MLRTVALPVEHGGWGFLLEPVVLGLVLAPSPAGLAIGVAALAAFLARHPLRMALADHSRGVRYPRTAWAEAFTAAYGLAAAASFAGALASARESFWVPLAVAAPLALVQLLFDTRRRGRDLVPELAGGIALGATVSMIALAGGWPMAPALALWGILAARAVASVLYIRARLRLDRGLPSGTGATWGWHVFGLAAVGLLAALGWVPWLAVAAFAALLARAVHGLSSRRRPVRPQVVGFREMGFGALTVLLVALGHSLRL